MVEMEEGLVFARDIGAQWLILEDDSTVIIIVVQLDCSMGVALVTWYLRYSRVGVFLFRDIRFNHARRGANQSVHLLARLAQHGDTWRIWLKDYPVELSYTIRYREMLEWIGSFLIWWLSFVSLSYEMIRLFQDFPRSFCSSQPQSKLTSPMWKLGIPKYH